MIIHASFNEDSSVKEIQIIEFFDTVCFQLNGTVERPKTTFSRIFLSSGPNKEPEENGPT